MDGDPAGGLTCPDVGEETEDEPSWPAIIAVWILAPSGGLGLLGWLASSLLYCGDPCTDIGFWRWDRFAYALGGAVVFGGVLGGALWLSRHVPTGTGRAQRAALVYAVLTTVLGVAGAAFVVPMLWVPSGWALFLSARNAHRRRSLT